MASSLRNKASKRRRRMSVGVGGGAFVAAKSRILLRVFKLSRAATEPRTQTKENIRVKGLLQDRCNNWFAENVSTRQRVKSAERMITKRTKYTNSTGFYRLMRSNLPRKVGNSRRNSQTNNLELLQLADSVRPLNYLSRFLQLSPRRHILETSSPQNQP